VDFEDEDDRRGAGNVLLLLVQDSRLAGVRINSQFPQPRALPPDGSPDLTVFAFELLKREDRQLLNVGETVDLIP